MAITRRIILILEGSSRADASLFATPLWLRVVRDRAFAIQKNEYPKTVSPRNVWHRRSSKQLILSSLRYAEFNALDSMCSGYFYDFFFYFSP